MIGTNLLAKIFSTLNIHVILEPRRQRINHYRCYDNDRHTRHRDPHRSPHDVSLRPRRSHHVRIRILPISVWRIRPLPSHYFVFVRLRPEKSFLFYRTLMLAFLNAASRSSFDRDRERRALRSGQPASMIYRVPGFRVALKAAQAPSTFYGCNRQYLPLKSTG